MIEIRCVVDARAQLGEGTWWDPHAKVLWWVDIWAPAIHRFDPVTGRDDVFPAPEYLGCLAVREKGGLVVSMLSGFHFFDPATGAFEPIVDPEADLEDTRFNDGKTDRQGRFWAGTMFEVPGRSMEFVGALYRLDPDLSCHKMVGGVGCSNGLAWSPDGRTMYYADSHAGSWAWDFDPATGDIENRRVFIDFSSTGGVVDGATVDADGCYWVTIPPTGKVSRYDPQGKLMQTITLPVEHPTCCEFGGADLSTLYVTTAILRREPHLVRGQPQLGGLFAVDGVDAKGIPNAPFRG